MNQHYENLRDFYRLSLSHLELSQSRFKVVSEPPVARWEPSWHRFVIQGCRPIRYKFFWHVPKNFSKTSLVPYRQPEMSKRVPYRQSFLVPYSPTPYNCFFFLSSLINLGTVGTFRISEDSDGPTGTPAFVCNGLFSIDKLSLMANPSFVSLLSSKN